jgi:hypothetical protein
MQFLRLFQKPATKHILGVDTPEIFSSTFTVLFKGMVSSRLAEPVRIGLSKEQTFGKISSFKRPVQPLQSIVTRFRICP